MNASLRLGLGSALMGFGFLKLLAQVFLLTWEIGSRGQHDIAARGVWLLAAGFPQMAVVSVLACAAIVLFLSRQNWRQRLAASVIGSSAGAAAILVGADPSSLVLRSVSPSWLFYGLSTLVAVGIACAGVLVVRATKTRSGVAPAAA